MHSATIIIPLSKEEALKKMIQEFLTTLSRQNSSCMARYWMQVCCESRVYDDCGSGGQEMCLLMLQTVATETNVCGSGAAVIELST